jgi:hypothetical protein
MPRRCMVNGGTVPVFLISAPYGVKLAVSRPDYFTFAEGATDVHSILSGVGSKALCG